MSTYYPPYKSSSSKVKVELDLTNYATKTGLKNITHTDVSSFASKTNLAALKTEVDKIDTDKLKTVPDDLVKLIWCIWLGKKISWQIPCHVHTLKRQQMTYQKKN